LAHGPEHPLGASEEELQRLQEIARGKDAGSISKEEALERVRASL